MDLDALVFTPLTAALGSTLRGGEFHLAAATAYLFGTCWSCSKASPTVKDPAFWREGNSSNVFRNPPTTSGSGYMAHA